MVSVRTTTSVINGTAAEQVVAVADDRRSYIALYAKMGECKISIGETPHTSSYMRLAEGNIMELAVNILDKIVFSTAGSVLNVIQDIDSRIVLSYNNFVLTSDGHPLAYNQRKVSLPSPIFA